MKTFRKGGAVLLTLCMLLCCMIPAFAEEPKPIDLPGSNVGYLFDAETGTMTIVLTHGGKSGSIGDNPNSGAMIPDADKVKHIEIAPWVTGIGERAFAGFTGLETIRIPFTPISLTFAPARRSKSQGTTASVSSNPSANNISTNI